MHRVSHARARLSLAVVLVVVTVRQARAAGPEEAEAELLIARGIELREHGKDDDALAVFKRALAKSPSPRARAQVALAEQALGLWVAAESDLVRALGAVDDAWIAKNRVALEGALAIVRRSLGTLEVRGTEGAEVVLDGVRLGVLPATEPFRVEAGRRTLEIRAKGFHPTTRSLEIPAGGVSRATVVLVPLAAEPADPEAARKGTRPEGEPGRAQRVVGWGLTGTGAALVVTGGVALLVRKGVVDDYNDTCPGLGVGQSADCDGKIDAARTWLTVSVLTLVGGGIFMIGGLTLVATAPRRAVVAAGGVRIGCTPASLGGGAALACAGSF